MRPCGVSPTCSASRTWRGVASAHRALQAPSIVVKLAAVGWLAERLAVAFGHLPKGPTLRLVVVCRLPVFGRAANSSERHDDLGVRSGVSRRSAAYFSLSA